MARDRDAVWVDSMPAAYAEGLEAAVFAPFAEVLAGRVGQARRVLEIAAGTGVVTGMLAGDVLATDLNPAMVELGARRTPGARWQQADAAHLPAADGSIDAAVCGFGVMFFPDRVGAYAEVRRVLAPGGRFLFTAWDGVDTHDFAAALVRGLRAAFPADPPAFVSAVPHGYADPARMRDDLTAAGYADVEIERVVLVGTARSAEAVARGFCAGTPLRAQLTERGDLEAATRVVAASMTDELGTGEVRGEMAAYLVTAR